MKKSYAILLAALTACAVSCNKEGMEGDKPSPEGRTVTFTATMEEQTKTVLDGKVSLWTKGDVILINGVEFTAILPDGQERSSTATFTSSSVPSDFKGPYKAVYGGFKELQNAVAGSYDPQAAYMTAESQNHDLTFRNETTLLKFRVRENGVKTVKFKSGDYVVTLNAPAMEQGNSTFATQTDYFIAVKPGRYSEFDLTFGDDVVKTYIHTKPIDFTSSKIVKMGDLGYTGVFLRGNKAAIHQETEWGTGIQFAETGQQHYVIKNVRLDEGAQFKVYIENWNDKWLGTNFGPVTINNWWGIKTNEGGNITAKEPGVYTICFNINAKQIKLEK